MSERPAVDCERYHATLKVADLRAAIEYYTTRLGFELAFTWPQEGQPDFAGVKLGETQLFLHQTTERAAGIVLNFVVGDADELFAWQRERGASIAYEPTDFEWGLRDFGVRDLDGHTLRFGHYIYNSGEPVEIERVDVPVRLEKRLAGLLDDLARHKHMSVDSLLEEVLLHTSEPLGDGVASPHTQAQLRHIQALKTKHGIDYDTHASYRFVEKSGKP